MHVLCQIYVIGVKVVKMCLKGILIVCNRSILYIPWLQFNYHNSDPQNCTQLCSNYSNITKSINCYMFRSVLAHYQAAQ